MKNNHHPIARTSSPRERLSEVGSMLTVAIRRLYLKEERVNREIPLDSRGIQSVNPSALKVH